MLRLATATWGWDGSRSLSAHSKPTVKRLVAYAPRSVSPQRLSPPSLSLSTEIRTPTGLSLGRMHIHDSVDRLTCARDRIKCPRRRDELSRIAK